MYAVSAVSVSESGVRPVLADAAEVARRALVELEPDGVGVHLGVTAEDETAATHRFEATLAGYRGWQWAVVVAAPPEATYATVSESALLPGPDALIAPDFVPWEQRVRPGDLGPGDLLAPPADDPRLVPGYVATGDPVVDEVAREVGLGRTQVLSLEGRIEAAERWYAEFGPDTEMAKAAPSTCGLCGFYLPLAGALRESFGVCGNAMGADGHVVHVEYGCGAHSDVVAPSGNGSPRYEAFDDDAVDYVEITRPEPTTTTNGAPESPAEPAATGAAEPAGDTTAAQETAEAEAVEAAAAERAALAEGVQPESAAEVIAAESASPEAGTSAATEAPAGDAGSATDAGRDARSAIDAAPPAEAAAKSEAGQSRATAESASPATDADADRDTAPTDTPAAGVSDADAPALDVASESPATDADVDVPSAVDTPGTAEVGESSPAVDVVSAPAIDNAPAAEHGADATTAERGVDAADTDTTAAEHGVDAGVTSADAVAAERGADVATSAGAEAAAGGAEAATSAADATTAERDDVTTSGGAEAVVGDGAAVDERGSSVAR